MYLRITVYVVIREVGAKEADTEGGNGPLPDTNIDPAVNYILKLFKRLGIEKQCAACMINIEQLMSPSDLVNLDNRQIEYICSVNRRVKHHVKIYILGTE